MSSQICGKEFSVVIDYSLTIEEIIKAGKYDNTNFYFKFYNHTIRGEVGNSTLILVQKHEITGVGTGGLRHANLFEILAFGAKYPNEQRKGAILTLGSVLNHPNGKRFIPYLFGGEDYRELELDRYDISLSSYSDKCRFLVALSYVSV